MAGSPVVLGYPIQVTWAGMCLLVKMHPSFYIYTGFLVLLSTHNCKHVLMCPQSRRHKFHTPAQVRACEPLSLVGCVQCVQSVPPAHQFHPHGFVLPEPLHSWMPHHAMYPLQRLLLPSTAQFWRPPMCATSAFVFPFFSLFFFLFPPFCVSFLFFLFVSQEKLVLFPNTLHTASHLHTSTHHDTSHMAHMRAP